MALQIVLNEYSVLLIIVKMEGLFQFFSSRTIKSLFKILLDKVCIFTKELSAEI